MNNVLYVFFIFPLQATCPTHLLLLDTATLRSHEGKKSQISLLYSFPTLYKILIAVNIRVTVFLDVMSSSFVGMHQRFKGIWCSHRHDAHGNTSYEFVSECLPT